MGHRHYDYLESRGFEPERLEREWGLLGTGAIGSYKWRIIIPIYFQGALVSYTSRDVTGRAELKYKACPQAEEVVKHKKTIYGLDRASAGTVIVVEGPPDVWRLGPGAVALYGTAFTPTQVGLLKEFERRFIFFDSGEVEAANQAQKLADLLSVFPGVTEVLDLGEEMDPADLTYKEALAIRKEFLR
jgi:DNA primase